MIPNASQLSGLRADLASLEAQFLGGLNAYIDGLTAYRNALTGGANGVATPTPRRGRPPGSVTTKPGKRKRAVVTDDTRSELRRLVKDGKTGGQMAAALGISIATVQNLKKQMGLVRKA